MQLYSVAAQLRSRTNTGATRRHSGDCSQRVYTQSTFVCACISVKAMRLLHLVGYRGNSAEFPDNTLPALRSAIALGARFIQFDVHLSADGVPMVCDEHQDRKSVV